MNKILPMLTLLSCLVYGGINIEPAASKISLDRQWKKLDLVNYSIRYPAKWNLEQKDSPTPGAIVINPLTILSPMESPQDKFRENVNLVIEQLVGRTIDGVDGQNINLDKYAELSTNQLKLEMRNFHIVETKRNNTIQQKYHKITFTWEYNRLKLKVEQYYWVVKGKAYVLTFTSERDKFNKFRADGEKVLNSFKIKDK